MLILVYITSSGILHTKLLHILHKTSLYSTQNFYIFVAEIWTKLRAVKGLLRTRYKSSYLKLLLDYSSKTSMNTTAKSFNYSFCEIYSTCFARLNHSVRLNSVIKLSKKYAMQSLCKYLLFRN